MNSRRLSFAYQETLPLTIAVFVSDSRNAVKVGSSKQRIRGYWSGTALRHRRREFADGNDFPTRVFPRSERESPFGGTIAHGFLTLSLLGKFYDDDIILPFCDVGINYGLNKVRFTNPVRAGSRVRGRFVLSKLDAIDGGIQMAWTVTFEIEGLERPACVAEHVVRRYFHKS